MKTIVTGASKGIGRGIATYLGRQQGYELGLIARTEEQLREVAHEIEDEGGTAHVALADLRDPASIRAAIDHLAARMGCLDALVNNAGLVVRKNVFDLADDEWDALVETNVTGLFHATRAALAHMKEQGSGHIVNVSSISGRVPLPGGSAYAATKYAVSGFTESLFQEVRDYGIKTTLVYPGSVASYSERHGPGADESWKVTPEEVGQAIHAVLQTSPGAVVSLFEIRPLNRPPKP